MLDTIFLQVLNMSLTASYVILVVLFVRLLLKKTLKIFSYALWSVVFFRLLCPFSFESLFSFLAINTKSIPDTIMYAKIPQIDTGISSIDSLANPILATQQAVPYASINPMQIHMFIAEYIWIAGISVLFLYGITSLLRLRSQLIGAVRWRDNIYLADHIASPFVIGFIRPKIYLPSILSKQEQEYIILHEQTHIKHMDHITKMIAVVALTLHWFNPLVWIAFILFVKDMEMSCDENVIKQMDTDIRQEYSISLLRLAAGRKITLSTPLAFGENNTKARIKNVLNYQKPSFKIILVSVIAVIIVFVGLMTNPIQHVLPVGTYKLENAQKALPPSVVLGDEKQFVFHHSVLSSYLPIGSYKVSKDELILTTDDQRNIYIFKIVNGKLIFQADNSSEIPKYAELDFIEDGSVFIYTGE